MDVVDLDERPIPPLGGFRMEVELVEPLSPHWRCALTRFLVAYVLLLALVAALTAVDLATATRAGSVYP